MVALVMEWWMIGPFSPIVAVLTMTVYIFIVGMKECRREGEAVSDPSQGEREAMERESHNERARADAMEAMLRQREAERAQVTTLSAKNTPEASPSRSPEAVERGGRTVTDAMVARAVAECRRWGLLQESEFRADNDAQESVLRCAIEAALDATGEKEER